MKFLIIIALIYITNCNAATQDFESVTDVASMAMYPNCKGSSTAEIDSTQAHGGKKSLKITGKGGYCNHIYIAPLTGFSAGATLYVRMWIRHTTALPAAHIAFIAMHDNSDGKDLRIGGQNKALQWNRESDDATLPEQSPNGVALSTPLPTGKWVCMEYMITQSGTAQTWLDGTEVAGLHAGNKVKDIDTQWLGKAWSPKLTDLRVGWEAYGEGDDTLWYDDIATGSAKIGCA